MNPKESMGKRKQHSYNTNRLYKHAKIQLLSAFMCYLTNIINDSLIQELVHTETDSQSKTDTVLSWYNMVCLWFHME